MIYNEFMVISIVLKFLYFIGESLIGFYIYVVMYLFFKSKFFDDILIINVFIWNIILEIIYIVKYVI